MDNSFEYTVRAADCTIQSEDSRDPDVKLKRLKLADARRALADISHQKVKEQEQF